MNNETLKSIDVKLTTIIKLISLDVVKGRNFMEQVELLSTIGMSPADIASCLGKSPNNVRVTLHLLRKKASRKTTN